MPWLLIGISIALLFLAPTAYAGWIGAPYAPTRLPVVRRAFKLIGLGRGDMLIDLGAGDGSILLTAAAQGATALGYELSPIMWLVARWRSRGKSAIRVRYGNFYKSTLPDASVIFVFLMPKIMPRVRQYLSTQHLPRAKYLLSYAFPLPDVQPLQVVRVERCAPLYIYDLKALTLHTASTDEPETAVKLQLTLAEAESTH